MSFMCSWAAFEGVSKSDLLERLGLVDTGLPGDWLDEHLVCAVTPKGWVVLVGGYDLFHPDRLLALSAHGRLVGGQAEDNECTDHLMACEAGRILWAVWHDAAVQAIGPDMLEVEGDPPAVFAEIRRTVLANLAVRPGADWMFDAPLDLLNALCGWDPQNGDPEAPFTRVTMRAPSDWDAPPRRYPPRVSSLEPPPNRVRSPLIDPKGDLIGTARLGAYLALWFAFVAMAPFASGEPIAVLCGVLMVVPLLWLAWRIWFRQDLWAIRWLWLPALVQAIIFLVIVIATRGAATDVIVMLGVNGVIALGLMVTGRAARLLAELRAEAARA